MRDLDRWKDKVELQLDGRQIFFLFFGSAICACLIFVLGVVVGRRVEARNAAQVGNAATDPLAALDELGTIEEGLTFHSTLADKADGRRPARGERPAAALAAVKPEAKPEAAKPEATKPEATKPEAAKPEAAKPEATKPEAKPESVKPEVAKAEEAKKGHFTLQLSAFATKNEAVDFVRRLREAGYKPFIIESQVPGKGLMYRVRLGDFTSRETALTAKNDFEKKQKMVAYVAKL